MVTVYKGVRYETLCCSTTDGFEIELHRRYLLRRQQLVVAVYRPEVGDEPSFEVNYGKAKAPKEFIEKFIEDAKDELQKWRMEWAQNFPELVPGEH